MLLEIPSGRIVDIPLLKSTSGSSEDDYFSDELISVLTTSSCGIHSIQRSPGNSKLATSGHNPNHLAVYSLPNLDPYIIGKVWCLLSMLCYTLTRPPGSQGLDICHSVAWRQAVGDKLKRLYNGIVVGWIWSLLRHCVSWFRPFNSSIM